MEVMHERVAGLDVHKAMIVACVAMLSNFGPGVLANFGPPPVPQPTVTLMDQGAFCGLESQSGIVRAAPSGA
jgi:hypothetical protein